MHFNLLIIMTKCNFSDKVKLFLRKQQFIVKPTPQPRQGWEEVFKNMAENGDDKLLFEDVLRMRVLKNGFREAKPSIVVPYLNYKL